MKKQTRKSRNDDTKIKKWFNQPNPRRKEQSWNRDIWDKRYKADEDDGFEEIEEEEQECPCLNFKPVHYNPPKYEKPIVCQVEDDYIETQKQCWRAVMLFFAIIFGVLGVLSFGSWQIGLAIWLLTASIALCIIREIIKP